MTNIAIIPARCGSKGVKDKNIKELCKKPLMAYTIEAALNSEQFSEVMVSTDSEYYAHIAKRYGAEVPFLRSEATASDTASSWDMVEEVLSEYENRGRHFETFCLLQPTSPLRDERDITAAYELYKEKASFAVVSVCEAEHSPLWTGHLPSNCEFVGFIDADRMEQRQTGGTFYRLNGALYIVNIERFRENRYLYQQGSFAYIMSQEKSVDIDSELDFLISEAIMKNTMKARGSKIRVGGEA